MVTLSEGVLVVRTDALCCKQKWDIHLQAQYAYKLKAGSCCDAAVSLTHLLVLGDSPAVV